METFLAQAKTESTPGISKNCLQELPFQFIRVIITYYISCSDVESTAATSSRYQKSEDFPLKMRKKNSLAFGDYGG